MDMTISDKIMPSNIKNLPQAVVVQCINLLHISFVDCPALQSYRA